MKVASTTLMKTCLNKRTLIKSHASMLIEIANVASSIDIRHWDRGGDPYRDHWV